MGRILFGLKVEFIVKFLLLQLIFSVELVPLSSNNQLDIQTLPIQNGLTNSTAKNESVETTTNLLDNKEHDLKFIEHFNADNLTKSLVMTTTESTTTTTTTPVTSSTTVSFADVNGVRSDFIIPVETTTIETKSVTNIEIPLEHEEKPVSSFKIDSPIESIGFTSTLASTTMEPVTVETSTNKVVIEEVTTVNQFFVTQTTDATTPETKISPKVFVVEETTTEPTTTTTTTEIPTTTTEETTTTTTTEPTTTTTSTEPTTTTTTTESTTTTTTTTEPTTTTTSTTTEPTTTTTTTTEETTTTEPTTTTTTTTTTEPTTIIATTEEVTTTTTTIPTTTTESTTTTTTTEPTTTTTESTTTTTTTEETTTTTEPTTTTTAESTTTTTTIESTTAAVTIPVTKPIVEFPKNESEETLSDKIKFEVKNYTILSNSSFEPNSYSLRIRIKGFKWNDRFSNVSSSESQELLRTKILPLLYKSLNLNPSEINEVKLIKLFKGSIQSDLSFKSNTTLNLNITTKMFYFNNSTEPRIIELPEHESNKSEQVVPGDNYLINEFNLTNSDSNKTEHFMFNMTFTFKILASVGRPYLCENTLKQLLKHAVLKHFDGKLKRLEVEIVNRTHLNRNCSNDDDIECLFPMSVTVEFMSYFQLTHNEIREALYADSINKNKCKLVKTKNQIECLTVLKDTNSLLRISDYWVELESVEQAHTSLFSIDDLLSYNPEWIIGLGIIGCILFIFFVGCVIAICYTRRPYRRSSKIYELESAVRKQNATAVSHVPNMMPFTRAQPMTKYKEVYY